MLYDKNDNFLINIWDMSKNKRILILPLFLSSLMNKTIDVTYEISLTFKDAVKVWGLNVPEPNCCVAVMKPCGVTLTTTRTGPQHSSSGVGSTTVKFSVIYEQDKKKDWS